MNESTVETAHPIAEPDRIQSLDVLRGFALLGILTLNILGFGLHSAGYFSPLIGLGETESSRLINLSVWGGVSVFFEGALRCLFSMLFGAGVVLFTASRSKASSLYFKRNFWLLAFGLFDAYVLLWVGDILIVYALCGGLLYFFRNMSPRGLIVVATVLLLLMSAFNTASGFFFSEARETGDVAWTEFSRDLIPSEEAYEQQLAERRHGYFAAARFNAREMTEVLVQVIPMFLFWDALAMMLIGMAAFKLGVLDASWPASRYVKLAGIGFGLGLAANLYELWLSVEAEYDLLVTFPFFQPTYHVGRLGMALGYLGVVMLVCKRGMFPRARRSLAAVGRLALTNYLMQSLIGLVLFTGFGFALVGELERWQLYPVVLAIWALQLWFSPWWLDRHRFGPLEWLWRSLTYGTRLMNGSGDVDPKTRGCQADLQ